jgi:hypothetical protein
MAYDDKEIVREFKRESKKKDRAPLAELSDDAALKRLEHDIFLVLTRSESREFFVQEVEKLTARYGLRTGLEQRANARRLYDQYQIQKKNASSEKS